MQAGPLPWSQPFESIPLSFGGPAVLALPHTLSFGPGPTEAPVPSTVQAGNVPGIPTAPAAKVATASGRGLLTVVAS